MANCEDIFNQLNELRAKRDQLQRDTDVLSSIDPEDLQGRNPDEIIDRAMGRDDAITEKVRTDVEKMKRSNRQADRFNNAKALVDRVGEEQAMSMLTQYRGMDETWKEIAPKDYAEQVAAYSRADLVEALNDAADAAGVDLSDGMINAVQANVAPFYPILRNQAALKVYAEVGRANLMQSINQLAELLEIGDFKPAELIKKKAEVVAKYLEAIISNRARNIARTRAGQLLANEKVLMEQLDVDAVPIKSDGTTASPVADGTVKTDGGADAAAKKDGVVVEQRTLDIIENIQKDVVDFMNEKISATAEELSGEGTPLRRIIDAANEGSAGVKELREINRQIRSSKDVGLDDLERFEFGYERYARAGWKDSVLFAAKSIFANNYLNQKVVFAAQGMMAIPSNAVRIYVGKRRNPNFTTSWRTPLESLYQGAAAATNANFIAESVIRQSWRETFVDGITNDNLPFAGNFDQVNSRTGQMTIDDQYALARKVMDKPLFEGNFVVNLRDKLNWGTKMFMNHHIERMGGPRLPVVSALQGNSVIDNRAGLRTFMTDRSNELELEHIAENPGAKPRESLKYAQDKVAKELFDARPTADDIASYRKQTGAPRDVSDDAIAAAIVMDRVGTPKLDTPERIASFQKSRDFRMQGDTVQDVPGLRTVYNQLANFRKGDLGDFFVPFLKSWAEQTAWDLGTGGLTSVRTIYEIAGKKIQGKEISPELYGKAAGATTMTAGLLVMFNVVESMGDEAPVQFVGTALTEEDRQALLAQGKAPNTIHFKGAPQISRNLPIGNMPLLKTLLMYKDLKTAYNKGLVSDADMVDKMGALTNVFAGLIMRAPGLMQVQWLLRSMGQLNEEGQLQRMATDLGSRFTMSAMPTSGMSRTVGQVDAGFKGSDYRSLIDSSRVMAAESEMIEKLPADHPLRSTMQQVRNFLQKGGTPELVRLMGGRDRRFTYLGRKWQGYDFLPSNQVDQYPDGVPALQIGGNFEVETELDRLNKHQEPGVFRTHVLSGVPVTPVAINELEYISGTMVSDPRTTGDISSSQTIGGGEYIDAGGNIQTRKGVKVGTLLKRVVNGRTWREALNALFTSPEYQAWNDNELTTNEGSMSDDVRNERPGSLMVDLVNKHYNNMLETKFVEAGAQMPERYKGAAQYLQDQKVLVPTFEELRDQINATSSGMTGQGAPQ